MSKSKQKTTSNQTTNQTATTTPNTPAWIQQPWQQYMGQVSDLANSGQPLVAGPSALQQQAFQGASNLSTSPLYGQAAGLAGNVAGAGANTTGPAAQAQFGGVEGVAIGPLQQAQFGGVQGTTVGDMAQATNRNFTDVDLSGYMNTGLSGLIDAARADYDATGGQVRAQQSAVAAANGGARNSNNAIRAALTEGELSRAANTGLSSLRYNAFNTAAGLAQNDLARESATSQFNAGQTNQGRLTQAQLDASRNSLEAQLGLNASQFNAGQANQGALSQAQLDANRNNLAAQLGLDASQFNAAQQNALAQFNAGQMDQDLARQLQAAGLLGNLGQAEGADQRANIGLQAGLGEVQRGIENATGEAGNLAALQALLSGVPLQAFVGQTSTGSANSTGTNTTTNTPSLFSQVGQGASTAASLASLFSDERLKADIVPIRKDKRGRQWYQYRYVWDAPGTVHEGVMAQEIMDTDPKAVAVHDSGFLMVDYSQLEAA